MMNSRVFFAIAASFILHVIVLMVVSRGDSPGSKAPEWVSLELIAPERSGEALPSTAPESPAPPVDLDDNTASPERPARASSPKAVKSEARISPVASPGPAIEGKTPSGGGMGSGGDAAGTVLTSEGGTGEAGLPKNSAETGKGITLPRNLKFTDLDRLMNRSGQTERGDFEEKTLTKRRNRGAFVHETKRVQAAMNKRRSITTRSVLLELGVKKDDAERYLLSLHNRIAPQISHLLTSLDSPSEQLHKKIQQSPFKHNPFYVPPPDSERQKSLHGPMADLSLRTQAEFEILPTGEIGEVRMIRSSHNQMFDTVAIDLLLKSAPFSPPPKTLISMNDKAHVQWTIYRDWKKNSPKRGRLLLLSSYADALGDVRDAGVPNAPEPSNSTPAIDAD